MSAIPPTPLAKRDHWLLATLTAACTVLAMALLHGGKTSPLEAVSFVSGAACVWLAVRENIWNFPIGIVNSAAFLFVFFGARLYADSLLQVLYIALGFIGWYLWHFGGPSRTTLRITRATMTRIRNVSLTTAAAAVALYFLLVRVGDAMPFWDAVTTALSLAAQWLLDRKNVESWYLWITVDIIYVPMYLAKGLYLTALLYAVFLAMAVTGLHHWRRIELTHRSPMLG